MNKAELIKNGKLINEEKGIYKVGENQYVIASVPGNVIINTSRTVKTKEENDAIKKRLGGIIAHALAKQELAKQNVNIDDLSLEQIRQVVKFV